MKLVIKIKKERINLLYLFLFMLVATSVQSQSFRTATTLQTVTEGSIIIDMGITPQTAANALEPYGLVYKIVQEQEKSVLWAVNPYKQKDSPDFYHNGKVYRGGSFILLHENRTAGTDALLTSYQSSGTVLDTVVSDFKTFIAMKLEFFPIWTLDFANGGIAGNFLIRATIPATAYQFKNPNDLDCCDDIFAMPHADPTWASHNKLYEWIKPVAEGGCSGWIWAGCHAVSDLEQSFNPADPTERMNFLSQDDLVNHSSPGHANASGTPYVHENASDLFVQFMGTIDGATENGSEQIYLPNSLGWRASTEVSVYDTAQTNVPSLSPGKAAKLVYGPAFGDVTNGSVTYMAGHNIGGSGEDNIAAQRAFMNFCFLAPFDRISKGVLNIPSVVVSASVENVSATLTGGTGPWTYLWKSSCGGVFSSPTAATSNYTAPSAASATPCVITLVITDVNCGKSSFVTKNIFVVPDNTKPEAANDTATTSNFTPVNIPVLLNDNDESLDSLYFSAFIGSTTTAAGGTFTVIDGVVTYNPNLTVATIDSIQYIVCDTTAPTPLCDTAKIIVNITTVFGDNDADGILDDVDIDDDNDGILDTDETPDGIDPQADADSDGIPNYIDQSYAGYVDINGDDLNDNFDKDLDGIPNIFDLDSDNDAIPDALEANAGLIHPDYSVFTKTITGAVGANGWPDAVDAVETGNTALVNPDFDGDGLSNFLDIDSDNDGIIDFVEVGFDIGEDDVIPNFTDANRDGIDDVYGNVLTGMPQNDGDELFNVYDIDSDNDGITDLVEAQTTSGLATLLGIDTDNDGLDDQFDPDCIPCGGVIGLLLNPTDFDSDGKPDYIDTDSDNDGVVDLIEGNDANSDGIADVSCSSADSDSDGLRNCYDTDNITFNSEASNAPLQDTDGTEDKDWRDLDDDGDGKSTLLEIPDSDGNGIPDYLEVGPNPCGIGFASAGPATTVYDGTQESQISVKDPNRMLGAPNDSRSRFDNNNDEYVMDFGQVYTAGKKYIITWRARYSGQTAIIQLSESVNNSSFTDRTSFPSTTGNTTISQTFQSENDFRYLRFRLSNGVSDKVFEIEAVGIINENCEIDSDQDGIVNSIDIDDDNDGILDVDEGGVICPESTITNVTTGLSVGASSTADLIDGTYNNAFYFTDNQSYPVGNNEIFNIFFAAPIVVTEIRTVLDRTNSYLENGVNYKVQGFDGTSYINLTATLTSDGVATGDVEIFDLSANTTAYSNYRIFWVSGNQVGWAPYIHQIEVSIAPCDGSSGRDTDTDGVPDQLDLDSDNDGIADIIEAGGIDSNNDGVVDNNLDTDQDGWANTFDADNGGAALLLVDNDGDSFENYLDLDSDSDGIADNVEGQTTFAFLAPLGADTDGDGWDDRYDKDNGGTAIELSNNDGVDAPDYISLDSDGDGAPDHVEGFDDGGIVDAATDDLESRATAFESASGNSNKYVNSYDADSDGLADWMEDADSDGVPNFLDPQSTFYYDTDQDGLIDLYDSDNYGVASNLPDQDGDGSPDFRDADNSVGPLPIELISFTATKVGNVTELNWTTATELNNDYFTIERTLDGKTYDAILTHPGAGNSYIARSYKIIDYKPESGNNYYRLRQTDYDGRTELFNVVVVYFDVNLNATVRLYPNPTEGAKLNLELIGFDAGTYSLIVRSSKGKLIQTTSVSVEDSESVFQTQVLKKVHLSKGTYILQILGNRHAVTKLFIVK